jgi:pimeloyl-ACP methyl ester carboxylesterase
MPGLRRTVYLVALAATLSAGVTACSGSGSSSSAASGASGTSTSGSARQVAAVSRQVSFSVSGTTTYGTLDIPAHRSGQHLAAALLLAGSGPTDRNGDDAAANLEPHTLQLVAGVLAKMGIISLRFDKYFSGATGGGTFASDPGSITLSDFISQADAAYAFLARQPSVDTGKLLVAGHSEGGMYALLVAESVSPRPAGLALLEPQDERLLSLIQLQTDEQIDAAVSQGTFTAAAGRQNAAGVQQAITEFRAGQPVKTSGLAAGVVQLLTPELLSTANARYVRSDDAVDPPSLAAKLPRATRVLVTDGTADTNVPLSTIKPLVGALSGTSGPGLRVLTGVDHLLHGPGVAENTQVLAPSAVTALQAWAQPYAS